MQFLTPTDTPPKLLPKPLTPLPPSFLADGTQIFVGKLREFVWHVPLERPEQRNFGALPEIPLDGGAWAIYVLAKE